MFAETDVFNNLLAPECSAVQYSAVLQALTATGFVQEGKEDRGRIVYQRTEKGMVGIQS